MEIERPWLTNTKVISVAVNALGVQQKLKQWLMLKRGRAEIKPSFSRQPC